jgi:hypothetical protein
MTCRIGSADTVFAIIATIAAVVALAAAILVASSRPPDK